MTINPHQQRMSKPQERYAPPAGAREILLVRHGASDLDNAGTIKIKGKHTSDPELLPEGHAQAIKVCQRLRNENISNIFITPLQRTQQTAASLIISSGLTPIVIDELREAHMGDWDLDFHIRVAESNPLLTQMFEQESWDIIPNSEPMACVAKRTTAGMQRVINAMQAGTRAVVVSHGGIIAEICRQATQSTPFAFFGPENTSISRIIVHPDGRWTLRSFNDISHL